MISEYAEITSKVKAMRYNGENESDILKLLSESNIFTKSSTFDEVEKYLGYIRGIQIGYYAVLNSDGDLEIWKPEEFNKRFLKVEDKPESGSIFNMLSELCIERNMSKPNDDILVQYSKEVKIDDYCPNCIHYVENNKKGYCKENKWEVNSGCTCTYFSRKDMKNKRSKKKSKFPKEDPGIFKSYGKKDY